MLEYYRNNSVKIITLILAIFLTGLYIALNNFTNKAYLSNPVYSRENITKIEFTNFIGTIELTTSQTNEFKLEYTNRQQDDPSGYYPLFKMGTPTIVTIDGRFDQSQSCRIETNANDELVVASIRESNAQQFDIKDYPILKITASKDIILDVKRSNVFGFATNIGAVKFDQVKCSYFTIGKVNNDVEFDLHSEAYVKIDDIGGDFNLTSQGDNVLILQNIDGNANVALDSRARFYAAEINGNLIISSTGDNVVQIGAVNGTTTYSNP